MSVHDDAASTALLPVGGAPPPASRPPLGAAAIRKHDERRHMRQIGERVAVGQLLQVQHQPPLAIGQVLAKVFAKEIQIAADDAWRRDLGRSFQRAKLAHIAQIARELDALHLGQVVRQ